MFNRGIVPRDKAGKRTTPKNYEKALDQIAFLIGRKLKQTGLEPFPFYDRVINDQWVDDMRKALVFIYGKAGEGGGKAQCYEFNPPYHQSCIGRMDIGFVWISSSFSCCFGRVISFQYPFVLFH